MPKSLVIVESPAKARTIAGFLGSDYIVESSIGHIRDLPRNASEVPAKYKELAWSRLGVDVDNDFDPLYVVPKEKRDQVRKLKHLLKDADELYLATDEDREGESIAWHLTEVLGTNVPVRRMVFHEITGPAIQNAIDNPRDVDMNLVGAQEARRILDRLYGYEVSPVLWKKVQPKLSAGRVQSVAIRVLVERERERIRFRTASYWSIDADFSKSGSSFPAKLQEIDGRPVARGKDFTSQGRPRNDEVVVLDQGDAEALATQLTQVAAQVRSVETKPYRRQPYAPFRTATLQQEAGRKHRFSAARTMSAAQRLYENGFITYMRTDSTALSGEAVAEARRLVAKLYSDKHLPQSPRTYARQVRNAQEAHEAIRPAGERWRPPNDVKSEVGQDEATLYELIWKRTLASQMADAVGETVQVRISVESGDTEAVFSAGGRAISFLGFLQAYVVDRDDPSARRDDEEQHLPQLAEADILAIDAMKANGHETKPPARYTEASLVRHLEKMGVGRPSTYASIISTIQDRGYAWKQGTALVPSFVAFATVGLMEKHFPDLVDYRFTARMEDDLDQIATGQNSATPWLAEFYFGNGSIGLRDMVAKRLEDIDAREINSIPIGEDSSGQSIVVRVGRYGPYLQRGDDTASAPDRLPPDELTVERAMELLEMPSDEKILGTDPETGLTVLARTGRFGPYVQLGDPEEVKKGKPKTASLFKTMDLDEIGLDDAMRLLSLPRVVGADPESEEEITAQNGRYGPYIRKGKETRSLVDEGQLFTVTLEEALDLLSKPRTPRGRQSAPPLRELGEHPDSGQPIVLRDGRYGPYVTDGDVNAGLRKSDDPETIDLDRAVELLALRRERLANKK